MEIRQNEPIAPYTTFKVGGSADYLLEPSNLSELKESLVFVKENNLPVFLLGGGSNILVGDEGISGAVICTRKLNKYSLEDSKLEALCGTDITELAKYTADRGYSGLHYFYSMPGTLGGAVWINARCFGGEISKVLSSIETVSTNGEIKKYGKEILQDFSYKKTPFQKSDEVIYSVCFELSEKNSDDLKSEINEIKEKRKERGHFMYPCAGSIFKNDYKIGKPTGALISELGLCGKNLGGAEVLEIHGNIIVNKGGASASDIHSLIEEIESIVKERTGFTLEREVLYVGKW